MPYSFRPANKLKLPGWIKSDLESGGKAVNPRELKKIPTQDDGSESPSDKNESPLSQFQLPLTSDPASSPPATSSVAFPVKCTASTKKTKMVRDRHVPTRKAAAEPTDRNLGGNATDRAVARTVDPLDNSEPCLLMAAAFPSLLTTAPTSNPTAGHIGVKQRLKAMNENKELLLQAAFQAVKLMYDGERFPASLPDEQQAWYTELKTRWLPGEENLPVCHSPPFTRASQYARIFVD